MILLYALLGLIGLIIVAEGGLYYLLALIVLIFFNFILPVGVVLVLIWDVLTGKK